MKTGLNGSAMFVVTTLAGLSIGAAAQAQTAPGSAKAGDNVAIEEIIVTAQKRDERLQDVPVSVAAFGEKALQAAKIDSGTEIARQTPNLRVSVLGNESQPKFALRGISTSEFNLNAVSPTGVFYDEVYIGAQYLGGAATFDVEQIEVLRGPQGTLFGKNTTAGAVNYISHHPTFQPAAEVTAGYGSYDFIEFKGVAEVPLVADRLTARIAFDTAHSGGYIENVNPAISDRSNVDRTAGRLTLAYKDDAGFKATLRLFHTESDARAIGVINEGLGAGGLNALGRDPRVNPYTGARMSAHQMATDRDGKLEVRGTGGYLTLTKDLGAFTVTSITSHLKGRFLNNVDADGTIDNLLHIDFKSRNKETSQDLRIATNGDGPLNWIAGVYYFRDDIGIDTTYTIFGGPPIVPILGQTYDQRRTSYAAYVDGTFDFTDTLTLYGGLRYTDDKGRMSNFQVTPVIAPQPNLTYHDAKPTGRIGLRAKVTPDMMVYGQFARGYRSSAFNGGALTNVADLNVADPEKLDAYELGLKSQWFDRRLTFNASAFLYNFSNQQFINLVGVSNQQLVNAGRSRIKGVEFELVGRPTERLTINAGLGLLDAKYKTLVLNGANLSGNDLIEAPPYSLNFGGDYRIPVGDGAITLHADAAHVGSQYFQASNTPLSRADAFWDVGARIAYADPSGRYELSVYGKNLGDNREVTGIVLDATSQTKFATVPNPRRFGVELTARF
ncbi:outer membrane receptor protein [Caulobacter sp. AP07]|uniref:TonB-dependent receptor n=1 Tax=Caulobacter sp. AP07 TaxID=1144304 RepID=UPI000271DA4A|nr:TonB-dependent receptor [Caulobacter sp. AP07]EJL26601.1 outer membrane receptor protein [Caulobacter sp. AP07]